MTKTTPYLGIPDSALETFPKGLLTKEEIRAIALFKMRLSPDSIVWDVGAGSGSLALEAALIVYRGHVYAIERRAEAIAALRRNLHRFPRPNITVVEGEAPEALAYLPHPDAVFVGGSGGHLPGILQCAAQSLRPKGRIVVDLATLENLELACSTFSQLGMPYQIVLAQVARSRRLGDLTAFQGLNPVFILSAWREKG